MCKISKKKCNGKINIMQMPQMPAVYVKDGVAIRDKKKEGAPQMARPPGVCVVLAMCYCSENLRWCRCLRGSKIPR